MRDSAAIAQHNAELKAEAGFLHCKRFVSANAQKFFKRAERRLHERQETLKQCQAWTQVQHEGLLLQSNLYRLHKGQTEAAVADWEREGQACVIKLDPLLDPKAQVVRYFKRAKKLRLGIAHAERLIQKAEEEVKLRQDQPQAIAAIGGMPELAEFCRLHGFQQQKEIGQPQPTKTEARKPYHHYVTEARMHIWVGKSAKDNDQLTFHWAKGSDWWLHAHNYPGSHVVLRCPKDQEPDAASIADAAELALRYSKAKDMHAGEVCLTQVKYLKRMKTPGKVMLSKHKVLQVL